MGNRKVKMGKGAIEKKRKNKPCKKGSGESLIRAIKTTVSISDSPGYKNIKLKYEKASKREQKRKEGEG